MGLVLFCFLIQFLHFKKENFILEHESQAWFWEGNASEGVGADLDFQP